MTGTFPLNAALDIFGRCAQELSSRPTPLDLATLLRRGDAAPEAITWASAAWALITEEDRRVLYLVHAALADDTVTAATGPLPVDVAARIVALVARLGPSLRAPEAFVDKLRHEELGRQVAAVLDLPIDGERDATTRHLRASTDSATAVMEAQKTQFQGQLNAARSAVDSKHAPARPYGE